MDVLSARLKKGLYMKRFLFHTACAVLLLAGVSLTSCGAKKAQKNSIAVFIPGILSDSPIYKMLADGVEQAVASYNESHDALHAASCKIIEANTNQAEWGPKLTALAAEGTYDVIISSNPSLPEIIKPILAQFPKQKFILLDAYQKDVPTVATMRYNQHEQAFLSGYISALMSKSHHIGLIAAQQYPIMDNVILPAYKEGAEQALPGTTVDYRIVGNWYDASKGAELARAMHEAGTDVILPICGGASQGVIATAKELDFFVSWFDSNGFGKAPGNIISSTTLKQDKLTKELTLQYLNGNLEWGSARTVGVAEGYVEFIQDDPLYLSTIPAAVREKVAAVVSGIQAGTISLPQND